MICGFQGRGKNNPKLLLDRVTLSSSIEKAFSLQNKTQQKQLTGLRRKEQQCKSLKAMFSAQPHGPTWLLCYTNVKKLAA
jgi:hypothetical protein